MKNRVILMKSKYITANTYYSIAALNGDVEM